jgi:predicted N-formylglutamate amidohydrolase
MTSHALIITCEHAVNTIPADFAGLFKNAADVLETHRGIDIGAKAMADHLALALPCDYYQAATISRLLIDYNRSLKNSQCFSEWTKPLKPQEKQSIINTYYHPFRDPVIQAIQNLINQKKRVIHLSIHSFTPILNGVKRETDIGLLYDPKRIHEKAFAQNLKKSFSISAPQYRVRMNYPYLGISDGFTCKLRKQFSEQNYVGLEIESNQALMKSLASQHALIQSMTSALSRCLKLLLTLGVSNEI